MTVTCDNVPPCPRFEPKCIPLLRNRRAERESTAATCLKCHRTTQANRRVALSIRPCRSLKRPVPVQPGERHVDAAQRDRRARRLSGPSCLPRLRCRPGQALPLRWLERPWCGGGAARIRTATGHIASKGAQRGPPVELADQHQQAAN